MSPDQGIFTAVDCVRTALITWIHITHVRGRSEHIMIIAFFFWMKQELNSPILHDGFHLPSVNSTQSSLPGFCYFLGIYLPSGSQHWPKLVSYWRNATRFTARRFGRKTFKHACLVCISRQIAYPNNVRCGVNLDFVCLLRGWHVFGSNISHSLSRAEDLYNLPMLTLDRGTPHWIGEIIPIPAEGFNKLKLLLWVLPFVVLKIWYSRTTYIIRHVNPGDAASNECYPTLGWGIHLYWVDISNCFSL